MIARVRQAAVLDAARVGALLTHAVANEPWKPQVRSAAEDIGAAGKMIERGWVTVLDAGETRVAGFLAREDSYVHALMVAPGLRGQGLGQRLLNEAKSEADELSLWTFARNRGARRFYEREGFAEVARTCGAFNDEGLEDVHFLWRREHEA